jgi:hypothetical protein
MKKYIITSILLLTLLSIVEAQYTFVPPTEPPGPSCVRPAYGSGIPTSREELISSVIRFTVNGSSCTGTLINRNTNEQTLGNYFITAWHCFKDGGECGGNEYNWSIPVNISFNYQSPPSPYGLVHSANASGTLYEITRPIRLVEHVNCSYGDFAICEIMGDPIPPHFTPYYAGWRPTHIVSLSDYINFSHPNGSSKHVATANAVSTNSNHFGGLFYSCKVIAKTLDLLIGWMWKRKKSIQSVCEYVQIPYYDTRYRIPNLTTGHLENGSSGSALFQGGNRVIGVFSGSVAPACMPGEYWFGKLPAFYHREHIMGTLNPSRKWSIDESGIPGRGRTCYDIIDYNYGKHFILYPASLYQRENAITLNSQSDIILGKVSNDVTIAEGADYTFNAQGNVILGPGFYAQQGATFRANSGVGCTTSGNYRTKGDEQAYEEEAKQFVYERMSSIVLPKEKLDLLSSEKTKKVKMVVYPNPIRELLQIEFYEISSKNVTLTLVDNLGREVMKKDFSLNESRKIQVPISENVFDGMYFVHVVAANDILIEKILVQK